MNLWEKKISWSNNWQLYSREEIKSWFIKHTLFPFHLLFLLNLFIFLYISLIILPVWHFNSLVSVEIWLSDKYWKRHFQVYSWNEADFFSFFSFLIITCILILQNIKNVCTLLTLLCTIMYLICKVYRNLWKVIVQFIRKPQNFNLSVTNQILITTVPSFNICFRLSLIKI